MPDGTHYSRQRETLLRLPIGELAAWHLVVECAACRAERYVMIRDLIARFGSEQRLVFLVTQLRCKAMTCRRPPSQVRLRSKFPAAMGGPAMVEVTIKESAR